MKINKHVINFRVGSGGNFCRERNFVMEQRSKSSQGIQKMLSFCKLFNSIGGVKGRRVLQYGNTSLLKGKRIYLDLHGYKRASFIESGLRERGAVRIHYFKCVVIYILSGH